MHNNSKSHKHAMLAWSQFRVNVSKSTTIGNRLVNERTETIKYNRLYVKHIVGALLYCAEQGIALRGHTESTVCYAAADENPGNFLSLLHLFGVFEPQFKKHLEGGPKNALWIAHSIQNEIIGALADNIRQVISNEVIHATYYTIMVDETKDISKKEQLSLVIRSFYQGKISSC